MTNGLYKKPLDQTQRQATPEQDRDIPLTVLRGSPLSFGRPSRPASTTSLGCGQTVRHKGGRSGASEIPSPLWKDAHCTSRRRKLLPRSCFPLPIRQTCRTSLSEEQKKRIK